MVDINSSIPPLLGPIFSDIQGLLNMLQIFVGGLFGLYLILVIIRFYEARKLKKTLKNVTDQLEHLNMGMRRIEKKLAKIK
jgi:hypothetical protein